MGLVWGELCVSVLVMMCVILCCEVIRRICRPAGGVGAGAGGRGGGAGVCQWLYRVVVRELVASLQVSLCCHELQSLGLPLSASLAAVYLLTVVNILTSDGALTNPSSALLGFLRRRLGPVRAGVAMLSQLSGAGLARALAGALWSLELSAHHRARALAAGGASPCPSALAVSPVQGAAAELVLTAALVTMMLWLEDWAPGYKLHLVAWIITGSVFLAGDLTGSMMNPALAYSMTFHCPGPSFLEYCLVYWLGPFLGVVTALMLFQEAGGERRTREREKFD